MIFERTMMFGFTLRNDIPTSSKMPTFAPVILAWIHRLKYFAKKIHATSENIAIAMIPSTTYVDQDVMGAGAWASSVEIIRNPLDQRPSGRRWLARPAGGRIAEFAPQSSSHGWLPFAGLDRGARGRAGSARFSS